MKSIEVKLSSEFKTQTTKAIIAIVFFIFTYFAILLMAIGLTILCVIGGGYLILLHPSFVTIALGVGLASLGILVLIFLLKFMTKSDTKDRSHLVEIFREDEPELFKMIDEIVSEVQTRSPKSVYLSADVNAAVFYDSGFWSMFLPVEKNLMIGMGLVNTVSKQELKAILSHEFGHFSQKTMKVGSYVYNLNQIIFNMLFENESYDELILKWARISGYFSVFVLIASKINAGIQWILRKFYGFVNKSYMGLSREMEFHADEIAASVTGYEPLRSSLLRLALAENSFNDVLNTYDGRIKDNWKSENLYKDQTSVMKFIAETNKLHIYNGLPHISPENYSKFDKSKLVIKNQWASHPSMKERVVRLENTGFSYRDDSPALANEVFKDVEKTQIRLTNKLFEKVQYNGDVKLIQNHEFKKYYEKEVLANSFSPIYNGYYDRKNPAHFELNNFDSVYVKIDFADLFSDQKVDLVNTAISLQNDIETLNNISGNIIPVKTFDYNGTRYKRSKSNTLAKELLTELDFYNEKIKDNDKVIYMYFRMLEIEQNKSAELERFYREFFEFDLAFNEKYEHYIRIMNDLQFVNFTTPYEQIKTNFKNIIPLEEKIKKEISIILADSRFQSIITNEVRDSFEQYISKTHEYFSGMRYYDEELGILFKALQNYAMVLSKGFLILKKSILNYQEELLKK